MPSIKIDSNWLPFYCNSITTCIEGGTLLGDMDAVRPPLKYRYSRYLDYLG